MRTVLVTGATGAIGSVVARQLLQENDCRLRLLLRADNSIGLDRRVGDLLRFWSLEGDHEVSSRIEAFAGDVTRPNLGLDLSTYQRLTRELTHVIHSAGNVKLNRTLAEARESAVGSARHVVAFVEACQQNGAFHKLEYLSTVGVAGRMPGVVPERALHEPRTFRNSYEAAKAEAETFVLERMRSGLRATVHRPSMVVGDSRTGEIIQFQVFYYLTEFLAGLRTMGLVPDGRDVRLDVVPVDYVARAIQVSSLDDDATGRVFHLCSGPTHAPLVNELSDQVRDFFRRNGRTLPRLRRLHPALLKHTVTAAGSVTTGRMRRSLLSLPYFLAYLDDQTQTFGNVESQQFFSKAGLTLPTVSSYLEPVLSYYVSHRPHSRGAQPTADRTPPAIQKGAPCAIRPTSR